MPKLYTRVNTFRARKHMPMAYSVKVSIIRLFAGMAVLIGHQKDCY